MHQEIHTENIAARAHAPEVSELLRLFENRTLGPLGVPYETFSAEALARFGDELMIVAPTGDGDYAYLHYGQGILSQTGSHKHGERISGMSPQVARFTIACFDGALADGKPVYSVHRSLKTVRVRLWERLILPAAAQDGSRFLIVFSRPLQFNDELLTTVLDTSPSGIVALQAVRDEDGNIERTVIITANRRAGRIAGRTDGDLLDTDACESLPFLAEAMVWRRCLYAIELRREDMIETSFTRDGQAIWLQIAVAPLGDGLVLTMTDVSDLVIANHALQSRAATLALEIGRERATRRALSEEIDMREEREQELRRLAETDPLTALLNRRSFAEKANQAIALGEADGSAMSLVIVDLDHFKAINDSHGHAAGDAVIRAFADLLLGTVRSESDLVSRFGGEEFAIFLPRCDAAHALRTAKRIQEALAGRSLPVSESLALTVSASFGIAAHKRGESLNAFVERTDRALYRAKNSGRNCIALADDDMSVAA